MGFLDKEHIVAAPGFSRWLVPPAALAIHLCIGQAYAFSVFNLPLSKVIGITSPAASDWKLTDTYEPASAAEKPRPTAKEGQGATVAVAWLLACAPLAWGVWSTFKKARLLFQ